jgi:mRNA-degrading endonuclease RelE of RelBE toxin-antitoxin system
MRFRPTEQFVEDYERLPERLQRRADRALDFLLQNLRYPSLRAKKMEGQRDPEGRDIWEARVTQAYRFTFAIDGDIYILYRIGPHDIERRPR